MGNYCKKPRGLKSLRRVTVSMRPSRLSDLWGDIRGPDTFCYFDLPCF